MYLEQINLGVLDEWVMDVDRRSQTPLGARLGGKSIPREMQGQINGVQWGWLQSQMLLNRVGGAGCRWTQGCVALAGHSTALLTFSSISGVERIPNVPVWNSKSVQHLSWDLLLLLISQRNATTWSGVIALQERVGLAEVFGVFQGLAASN